MVQERKVSFNCSPSLKPNTSFQQHQPHKTMPLDLDPLFIWADPKGVRSSRLPVEQKVVNRKTGSQSHPIYPLGASSQAEGRDDLKLELSLALHCITSLTQVKLSFTQIKNYTYWQFLMVQPKILHCIR